MRMLATNTFRKDRNKANARATCELAGAHHVDILSSAENNFVKNLVPITIIGVSFGYKRDSSGNFVWDRTGGAGPYKNWNTGEPNKANSGEGLWCDVHIRIAQSRKIGMTCHAMLRLLLSARKVR